MEPTFNFNAHNRGKLALELRTVTEIKTSGTSEPPEKPAN